MAWTSCWRQIRALQFKLCHVSWHPTSGDTKIDSGVITFNAILDGTPDDQTGEGWNDKEKALSGQVSIVLSLMLLLNKPKHSF